MARSLKGALVTRDAIVGGIAAGFVHAGVSIVLWNTWFEHLREMYIAKPQNAAFFLLGMFLLGFVPVLFYIGEKIRSPAVIVGVLLVLSGTASLLMGPVTAPSGNPTPFGIYILLWPLIVALAGVAGVREFRRNQPAPE